MDLAAFSEMVNDTRFTKTICWLGAPKGKNVVAQALKVGIGRGILELLPVVLLVVEARRFAPSGKMRCLTCPIFRTHVRSVNQPPQLR
jgi:hypothetical protein